MHDLRVHALARPDHPAIVCQEGTLAYGALEALVNRYAQVLRRLGLARGDHIASLLGNGWQALALGWAAYRCGLYLTPLSTALVVPELAHILTDCEAQALVADAGTLALSAALPPACPAVRHWLMGGVMGGMMPASAPAGFTDLDTLLAQAPTTPIADEAPGALMMYTSGTTGAPRGVLRPLPPADQRGTPGFAADLLRLFDIAGPEVRYLSTAPLYHAAPLRFALAVTAGGGTVHVMSRFDADAALTTLAECRITHSQWVPSMFQRLLALPEARRLAFAAPAHRLALHSAAPCSPAVKLAMLNWWGPILTEYYSGSEGVGLTRIDSAEWRQRPGSVGRAYKGEIHIADAQGQELPAGEVGQVWFSGIAPFAYFKAPEKTAAATHPRGWQSFGDIGHVDAEGYLYLSDRRDDLILSGGVNIYPHEIEQVLFDCDGVADCAVVGRPDERFGARPVAYLVRQPGQGGAESLNEADWIATLRARCAERLGAYKQPVAFEVVAQLPRTPTGKLLRRVLREQGAPNPS